MNAQTPMTLPAERKGVSYAAVEMGSTGAGGSLAPKTLGDVVAFAQVMARADLALPKHLRGNDGACMAVAMQAMRWEMDPFAVANKSYSVNDRLAYEAQLVAAVVHTRAPIKGRPNYIYSGEGGTRRCQVICTMADGEEREYTSPTFAQITTKNSPLWKSDPDQQLGYFAIRSWARRHTPEVILGVYTPDEVASIRDVTPAPTGLRARLEAAQSAASEGFTATQAEDDGPTYDATTGEIQDAEVEVAAEAVAAALDGDDLPEALRYAPEPEAAQDAAQDATVGDVFDAPAWAASVNRDLDKFETLEKLNAFTDDPANVEKFDALQDASPGLAKSLGAAITGKRKALADKEAAQ